jgi:hypothetical protein
MFDGWAVWPAEKEKTASADVPGTHDQHPVSTAAVRPKTNRQQGLLQCIWLYWNIFGSIRIELVVYDYIDGPNECQWTFSERLESYFTSQISIPTWISAVHLLPTSRMILMFRILQIAKWFARWNDHSMKWIWGILDCLELHFRFWRRIHEHAMLITTREAVRFEIRKSWREKTIWQWRGIDTQNLRSISLESCFSLAVRTFTVNQKADCHGRFAS